MYSNHENIEDVLKLQIRNLMKDEVFENTINPTEKYASNSFKEVVKNVLATKTSKTTKLS